MSSLYIDYVTLLAVLIMTALIFLRRPPNVLWPWLLTIMITVSLWAIGDVMIHIVPEHFTLAMAVLYTGVLVQPTAWFCFTLAFAGMVDRPMPFDSPRLRTFLVALIIPFWLAMATNTWHGLFITEVVSGHSVFNPIWYMQAAVNYCLVIASLGIFIYLCISVRFSGKVFLQTAIMAIGALIPIVTNFIYVTGIVDFVHDPTVMALSASALLFLIAIYRVRLFSLSPYSLQDQLDQDPDPYLILDQQGAIIAFSQAAETLFARSQLVTDSDGLGMLQARLTIIDEGVEFVQCLEEDSTTFTVKEEQKPHSWFRVSSHLVRTNRGRVRGVGVRLRDISDLIKHAETIAEQATERLQLEEDLQRVRNIESLGTLAGGIAHDFNNVLMGVIGNLTLLTENLDKETQAYEMAMAAQRASLKTTALTKQLMTFAKGGVPVKETASVEAIITETVSMSLQGTRTKPIYDFAEDLHYIDADADQIGQVIQNLALNAAQAMPEGGILEITASNIEVIDGRALVDLGEYVQIRVSDSGEGMTDDLVKHVFEPYFSTKEVGHGLGLSISHSIVQRHGGTLSVQSAVGRGSEFTILLPVSHGSLRVAVEEKHAVSKGSGRVLIVDDEPIIHESLGRMMVALGYEVAGAMDGEEGIRLYLDAMNSDDAFVMVVLDLTIPGGMGGREIIVKLKEFDPLVKAIVTSGYSNDEVMANYEEFGFCGRISKPVRLVTLSDELKRVAELYESEALRYSANELNIPV
jgi:signal transduction histidine kinase/CheY-like chemotaxis protein